MIPFKPVAAPLQSDTRFRVRLPLPLPPCFRALLRPGRFDVEVQVPVPDLAGRKEILQLYLGKVKVASDVSLDVLARGTTGFTGADLENVVNQAALRAAIDAAPAVSMRYLENARDKVLMGMPPSTTACVRLMAQLQLQPVRPRNQSVTINYGVCTALQAPSASRAFRTKRRT